MHPEGGKGLSDLPLVSDQNILPPDALATLQHAIQDDLRPHRLLQDQADAIISKAHAAVAEMAQEIDPECRVVVVGSLVTGLATKKSDVDVCLMTTMDAATVSEQLLELFRKSPSFKAYGAALLMLLCMLTSLTSCVLS